MLSSQAEVAASSMVGLSIGKSPECLENEQRAVRLAEEYAGVSV